MSLYKNKYRNESIRLQTWDYANDGAYYITICTKNHEHYFGEIENGKMQLTPLGAIAYILWCEIKNHAKNITLDEFVIMPNHVHGILILTDNDEFLNDGGNGNNADNVDNVSNCRDNACVAPTIGQNRFQNQGKNTISSIVGSYKSAVTKYANRLEFDFAWQSRFYDHIIRDEISFINISNYIINNPENWKEDKFYKKDTT